MQKTTTYNVTQPQLRLKPFFRKPLEISAKIILTVFELYDWIDSQLFMEDDPISMKFQYYGFLIFMITTGIIFLTLSI